MATRTPTVEWIDDGALVRITWSGLANGDDGSPTSLKLAQWADRSIQVVGTFGAGGSVSLQGTNDGTNYAALSDPQGVALAVTTAKIKAVTEVTAGQRPLVTAGDGTTNLTMIMWLRRGQPLVGI